MYLRYQIQRTNLHGLENKKIQMSSYERIKKWFQDSTFYYKNNKGTDFEVNVCKPSQMRFKHYVEEKFIIISNYGLLGWKHTIFPKKKGSNIVTQIIFSCKNLKFLISIACSKRITTYIFVYNQSSSLIYIGTVKVTNLEH